MVPTKNERSGKKKVGEIPPAKESSVNEGVCNLSASEERVGKLQNISGIFALLCCAASLYMQQIPVAIFCFSVYFVLQLDKLPPFLEKHGVKVFIAVSALVACFGIAVRIAMYVKSRSLWLDEALLANSIAGRNWGALLASPLSSNQSAPILYVVAVKAICSVLGYSELSLRIFSLFSFLGLWVCEWIFLKKILKTDDIKTAFVLILTAVVPCFVYYSHELKPYMSDAFFVVLALLLYAFYTQNKISIAKLTVSYVLILGFCTPAIFFIGGVLTTEFLAAAFARNKKTALYVLISGLSIVALFGLYYYLWMLPTQKFMDYFWNKSPDKSGFNAFFVVFVILLYFAYVLHREKKASLIILTISYALISGICPPAIFFVVGILAGEFFAAAFARNKKRFVLILASLLSITAVFGLCYLLRTSSVSEALKDFWNNPDGKIGLITGIKDIFLAYNINSKLIWTLVPFALLGIYSLTKQKNKIAYSVVLSVFFVCLASSIGKWPIAGRLWLFLPAVVLIFSAVGYDLISKGNNIVLRKTVFCVFSAITVFYTWYCLKNCYDMPNGMNAYRSGEEVDLNPMIRFYNMHVYTHEVNPLIQYVKEHIKNDEVLYVYPWAVPTLKFKNGYTTGKIGQTDKDNIIYGVVCEEWNEHKLGAELDTIIKSRKAYLLFQHYWRGITPGLAVLEEYGNVDIILNNYDTPLLYFEAKE